MSTTHLVTMANDIAAFFQKAADQGEAAVFVVRDDKAVRVPVQLGYLNGEVAEVREGLVEGELVVTTGKVAVREGSELQVLNPQPEAAIALLESLGGKNNHRCVSC